MCKTDENARNDIISSVSFIPRDKMSNGSREIEYKCTKMSN